MYPHFERLSQPWDEEEPCSRCERMWYPSGFWNFFHDWHCWGKWTAVRNLWALLFWPDSMWGIRD